jgi:hypothetical protein
LRGDHNNGLEEECELIVLKEVELEPEYIGEEEYTADIDREGADGLIEFDEKVLMEVSEYGSGGHA